MTTRKNNNRSIGGQMLRCIVSLILVACFSLPVSVMAQAFSSIHLPSRMCSGDTLVFTFGYNPRFDVVIFNQRSSLSHPGKVFLPDGEPCGIYGCSYRSQVTFTDFTPGATITSVQDIKFVRLNIEHSYIGDLYINITCPNGQKADLMRFGGMNDSGCKDAIPSTATGWLNGSNMALGNYFGEPVDLENSTNLCDSSAVGNQPGIGWNYCWSNCSNSGYVYASGDGIIYRNGHATGGNVDSSNVALGTNFYHPDENFNSLIGCPLNGPWYIEVVDGYSQDNGYIFDWELALEESLLPSPCVVVDRYVTSPYVQSINDSTYRFIVPPSYSDSSITIGLGIVTSCGDTIDTNVSIAIGHAFFSETRDTAVENALPVTFNGVSFSNDADTVFAYPTASGCDSVYVYHLKVWHNVVMNFDTAVCSNKMPAYWRGVLFLIDGTATFNLNTSHGADSIVNLTLSVLPVYDISFADTTCSNQPYFIGSHLCDTSGHYDYTLATMAGCDSVVHIDLTVFPAYDIRIDTAVCANEGYVFDDEHLYNTGAYTHSHTTVDGCDSLCTLSLTMLAVDLKAHSEMAPHIVRPEHPDVRLTDISAGSVDRRWECAGGISSEPTWIMKYPTEYDSVPVTLVAISREGCTDTFVTTVFIDRSAFYAPNVFTPDREDNNRWWPAMTDVIEMELCIYDRNGILVFRHDGVEGSWDGTCNGRPCPQGAYVYVAHYRTNFRSNRIRTEKGAITLLR